MLRKKNLSYLLLFLIIALGFWFRLSGILDNHSFWDDEAYIAAVARNLVLGKISISQAISTPGAHYQPLHTLIIALSLFIFGFTEYAARMPYVFIGSFGIIFAYLLATKLSNKAGGLLAAFLMAFSQINLANSTQAKPFTGLQTLFLIELYLIYIIDYQKRANILLFILLFVTGIVSTFIQMMGVVTLIPIFFYIFLKYRFSIFKYYTKQKLFLQIIVVGLLMFAFFFIIRSVIGLFTFENEGPRFPFNNLTYFRELFWRNYAFITLSSAIGFLYFLTKKLRLSLTFLSLILSLSALWLFASFTRNVRYILPLFGIIFVFFGVFWTTVGEKLFNNKSSLICFIVAVALFAGGYKIVRIPKSYYGPNEDIYGDVQIADYKTFYALLKEKYPDLNEIILFNNKPDTESWYLDRRSDGYFQLVYQESSPKLIDKTMRYSRLQDLTELLEKHPSGLFIVEDWQSMLPEDIKQYAKQNLKLEFRVEGLPQAGSDKWPLELYSF